MPPRLSKLCTLAIALLLLAACQPPNLWGVQAGPPTASATVTASSTPPPTRTATLTPTGAASARPLARRVLIVTFDGLRPDVIDLAPMPVLRSLMQVSAYTLSAQTIFPSATLPAHSSMFTGACPAKHGALWNDYLPLLGYAQGTDLFDLAHTAGLSTLMYVGKEKLRQITEPASTDVFEFINDRDLVIVDQLIRDFPADFGLMFVHLPLVDMMGHEYGWLSPEQLSVAVRGDQALARLLVTLDDRGLRRETLVIITSDHGGHDTTHGYSFPEDMTIPWIVSGPGIQPGQLTSAVQTMDTAATAAWALDLPIPAEWDGRVVTEAYGLPAPSTAPIVCPMPVLP
jgi:arylsulfatase A-like enzyme